MRGRLLALMILAGLAGTGCGGLTPEEHASLAAKGYYEHLMHGEYEQFLEGMDIQALAGQEDYHAQLLENLRQYASQQQAQHRGIREVRVSNAKTDTAQKYTAVFLVLCFGDSTNEEVVVPMVEREGRWRMK